MYGRTPAENGHPRPKPRPAQLNPAPHALLALQRSAGNAAVARHVASLRVARAE